MTYYYKIYGQTLVSDFAFPQLVPAGETEAGTSEIYIREGAFPEELKRENNCYSEIGNTVSYLSNDYCYLYVTDGATITYERKTKEADTLLNAYLLGWGMSMLFHQRGGLAIHCACVADERGAVIISGDSGCGKSTMTSYFLSRGYHLVADDMSVVVFDPEENCYATPAFPYQKQCRNEIVDKGYDEKKLVYIDEMKDKFLVPVAGEFSTEPVPVRAMLLLGFTKEEKPQLHEITGIDKMHACVHALFLRPLFREKLYAPENGSRCLKMAAKIPIYGLLRPRVGDTRQQIFQMVEEYLV